MILEVCGKKIDKHKEFLELCNPNKTVSNCVKLHVFVTA